MHPQNHSSTNPHFPFAFSHIPIPTQHLNSSGWVCDSNGLLFWVPEDCHYGLTHLPIMTIDGVHRKRGVRIDFTNFKYGFSWTEAYGG